MSPTEVSEYLEQPNIMRIAVIDHHDGYPVVHPVWFYYENEMFLVAVDREGRKAQSLRKNPDLYYLVDSSPSDGPPLGIRGRAVASVVDDSDYATRVTERNIQRYMKLPEGKAAEKIREMGKCSCVLEIRPTYMATWKF
ncbi:MAG TPA: pyridoxamine 5'-phosphate oxidase family protein [Nitrososphaera sp.]|nr:pyridoxamine 5'-phosphate oxidase family protein [Nitrososphaera sp.]